MGMKTYTTIDKSEWERGPWDDEVDKAQWIDEETDLDCLIVRNTNSGNFCGYVGVPPEHPWHGEDYWDHIDIDVHGGLTFAGGCHEEGDIESSICHIPEEGRPDDVWWFGFDCGHAWDISPGLEASLKKAEREFGLPPVPRDINSTYKDFEYTKREVEKLAKQLKEAS